MKPSMQSTWTFVALAVFAAGVAPAPAGASPRAQEMAAEVRYVRVKEGGAKLLNLADKDADVLAKASAGTVLAVHGESAGFLEVASPAGLEVWVYGEYVKAAGDPGLLEVTANGVRMRPQPSADQKSYALRQSLNKGDKVRFVARHDAQKPMNEDWVQVVSPTSAHAWVSAASTAPLAAGEDGKALFAAAERELAATAALVAVPRAETAPKTAAKPEVKAQEAAAGGDLLAHAEQLMETERKAAAPDFTAAKAAYLKVLDANPKGAAADTARARLQEIELREEIVQLGSDAKKSEQERQQEIAKKQEELRQAGVWQDPLWGRFQARGWLEKDGERYVIRWANKLTAEVVCTQKRYDLANFVGFEVGVTGITTRSAVAGADAKPARIDLSRIEVLSGAGTRR